MEFKKKTIIWEDNSEPPKDYIGAKKDGKFYEYSYATRSWIESKLIKAEESGGSDGGDGGDSTEIDYEAIYQFYKKKIIENIPEEHLEQVIIPEHYADVEYGVGQSEEYAKRLGIWKTIDDLPGSNQILFSDADNNSNIKIYFGTYKYQNLI